MTVDLFQAGSFRSHGGLDLAFKIECDAHSEREMDLFAGLIVDRLYRDVEFGRVVGVPKGQSTGRDNGGVLAQYVRRHLRAQHRMVNGSSLVLIVDDVLTTGISMEAAAASREVLGQGCLGAVIFARGPCPLWIRSLFTLNELAW